MKPAPERGAAWWGGAGQSGSGNQGARRCCEARRSHKLRLAGWFLSLRTETQAQASPDRERLEEHCGQGEGQRRRSEACSGHQEEPGRIWAEKEEEARGREQDKIPKALQSQAGSFGLLDPGRTGGGRVAVSCLSFRAGGGGV